MENKDPNSQNNNVSNDSSQPIPSQAPEAITNTPPVNTNPQQNVYPQPQTPTYTTPTNPVTAPIQNISQVPTNIALQPVEMPQITENKTVNTPGLITLQWLTYAFWGWTAIAVLWIAITVMTYYIVGSDVLVMLPYSIAAILVLLPISIVCDLFYMKKEPVKKTGAASVVMIIHAVIFALCGVGSLVTIVLNLVTIMISGVSNFVLMALASAGIMSVIYAVLFIRTIIPSKFFSMRKYAMFFISFISAILIILSITGPIVNISQTKNDKLIEDNISTLSSRISSYASSNDRLPDSLNDINNLSENAKKLVTDKLVTYKKEGIYQSSSRYNYSDSTVYKYQLCVNYKKADSKSSAYSSSYLSSNDGDYDSYLSTYGHPAGEVCYKLITR